MVSSLLGNQITATRNESEHPSLILIGGGVGPAAGVALHQKIIANTRAPEGDRQHRSIVHLSFSSEIPDRTRYLLRGEGTNPGVAMAQVVNRFLASVDGDYDPIRIGIPCNTFHAAEIFQVFQETVTREIRHVSRIQLVNMLEVTSIALKRGYTRGCKIGLLSTTGTRAIHVWRDHLEADGFSVVEVPNSAQEEVHNLIYDKAWGLKSVWPPSNEAKTSLLHHLNYLADHGAVGIVLGCTELPLAVPSEWKTPKLIDPVECLAWGLLGGAPPDLQITR